MLWLDEPFPVRPPPSLAFVCVCCCLSVCLSVCLSACCCGGAAAAAVAACTGGKCGGCTEGRLNLVFCLGLSALLPPPRDECNDPACALCERCSAGCVCVRVLFLGGASSVEAETCFSLPLDPLDPLEFFEPFDRPCRPPCGRGWMRDASTGARVSARAKKDGMADGLPSASRRCLDVVWWCDWWLCRSVGESLPKPSPRAVGWSTVGLRNASAARGR